MSRIADAGFTGFMLREADRAPQENLQALELALKRFAFVVLHHRSRLPDGDIPLPHALHVSRGQTTKVRPFGWSCHTKEELDKAFQCGASYALLSPVFRPTSKPYDTRDPLGIERFIALAGDRPVLALGGINGERYRALRAAGAYGAAVLGDLSGLHDDDSARQKLARYDSLCAKGNKSGS